MRILRVSGVIRAPCDRVFAILEDAKMAQQLAPYFLDIDARRSAWLPGPGTRTQLAVVHRGVAVQLEFEITDYRRGTLLVERQILGPFAQLEHALHVERDSAGARVTEVLAYRLPFGWLGRLFDRLSLHRDLEVVLQSRLDRMRELLEPDEGQQSEGQQSADGHEVDLGR